MIFAKAAAYLTGWVALAVVLIRVIVGPLWGSATNAGLIAAPIAFALGVLALGKLASILLRDLAPDRDGASGKTLKSTEGKIGE